MDDIWPGIMLEPAAVPAYGYSGGTTLDDPGVRRLPSVLVVSLLGNAFGKVHAMLLGCCAGYRA
jgi:hypothetical protein